MPRLSEFYGIVIAMYWKDHQPPHFHAFYGEFAALDPDVLHGDFEPASGPAVRVLREYRLRPTA